MFFSFICCGTVASVAKINVWATKSDFGERMEIGNREVLQDVSAFIQYCNLLLPKKSVDGKMKVRCLKRSFLWLEDLKHLTHTAQGWNRSSESGKCGAFDQLKFFCARPCCAAKNGKLDQVRVHVDWVCILKRTSIPAKYLCPLNMH